MGLQFLKQKTAPFAHQLPYWTVENDLLVHVDGCAFTKGVALSGVDTWCLSDEQLNEYSRSLKVWLGSLPENIHAQIYFLSDEDIRKQTADYYGKLNIESQEQDQILNDKKRIFETIPGRRIRLFLFLTKRFERSQQSLFERILSFLPSVVSCRDSENDLKSRHLESLRQLQKIYNDTKDYFGRQNFPIQVKALEEKDYFKLLFEILNPNKYQFFKANSNSIHPSSNPFLTLREEVAASSCEEYKNRLVLDNAFIRVLNLYNLPDETLPAMMDGLIYKCDFPFRLITGFQLFDTQKYLEKIRSKSRQKKTLLNLNSSQQFNKTETIVATQEIDDLDFQITRSNERVGSISLTVVLEATSEEELERRTQTILTSFQSLNSASTRVEEYSQLKYFIASLPGNSHLAEDRQHICTSQNISDLLPVSQPWQGTKDAWVLMHTDRQSLVQFSPFSRELASYNQIVIGQTGAGKSFFINYLLNNYLLVKPNLQIFILDRGGSYKKFVEFWGGQYVDFNLNNPVVSITPFIERKDFWNGEDGSFDRQAVSRIASITEQMVMDPHQSGLGRLEFAVLEESIRHCYKNCSEGRPSFSDLQKILLTYSEHTTDADDIRIAKDLGKRLSLWTQGAYAKLFTGAPPLEVKSKIFCFDIQGTVDDKNVLGVIYATVANQLVDLMALNMQPKIFLCDEMWDPMSNRAGKVIIERTARTGRKNFMGMITSTQGSVDYKTSEASKIVLNQSKIRWILKVQENPEEMRQTLQLTDRELALTENLSMRRGEYSQVLLQCDEFQSVLTIYATPLLYWLATTNPQDRQLERIYYERFPEKSTKEIMALLACDYPKGYQRGDGNEPDKIAA